MRDTWTGPSDFRNTVAPLLGRWVAILAMKYGRAPLPVPSELWKGLLRKGFPNDLDELANFARRYLFLGDARMMLAELRHRRAAASPMRMALPKHSELNAEAHP
jgi:DNA-binding NtrC family response regulator